LEWKKEEVKKYLEGRYFEIRKIFGERLGEHNINSKILKIFFPKYTPHPHKETLCSWPSLRGALASAALRKKPLSQDSKKV
jgi:hypothetical protein